MSTRVKLAIGAIAVSLAAIAGWVASNSATHVGEHDILKELKRLTPAERMAKLGGVLGAEDFRAVDRGTVYATVVERGSVEAAQVHDVVCAVKGAATIRGIVDNGSLVKKGDTLVQLDDSSRRERLKDQRIRTAHAEAAWQHAKATLLQAEDELRVDLNAAQVALKLAGLELQKYDGKKAVERQILELKVKQAQLNIDRVKVKAAGKVKLATAGLAAAQLIHEKELGHERDLEADIKNCLMVAPADGMAIYWDDREGMPTREKKLAAGNSVVKGQKLLIIPDPRSLRFDIRILESQLERVRKGQKAFVQLDFLSKTPFSGQVSFVADRPDQAEEAAGDVRVYAATIQLEGDLTHLRPQMAGKAVILVSERPQVLRVPATAVLGDKQDRFCYVLAGKVIDLRSARIGMQGSEFAEIEGGLVEGDQVMIDPLSAAKRMETPK